MAVFNFPDQASWTTPSPRRKKVVRRLQSRGTIFGHECYWVVSDAVLVIRTGCS